MRKTFYQKYKSAFEKFDGLFLGNPVLERGLILAPVIVASYNYRNSVVLGLAFAFITFFAVLFSSFIPKKIPYTLRTIMYTLIACAVFVPTAMYLDFLYPESLNRIGVFLPLLVANSLIVVKSESRFHKHKKGLMIFDLFCHMIGFMAVILVVGSLRELFGSGSIGGFVIEGMPKAQAVLLPFSGFVIVGFLAAGVKWVKYCLENPKHKRKEEAETEQSLSK